MIKTVVESWDKTKIAVNHFKQEGRNAVIIICHGFSMSKDAKPFLNLSNDLFELCDVISMDQRGHGESEGVFSFSSKEHEDIKAVIDYTKESYRYVYLMGFSLGAASSVIQVAKNKNVNGLIIISSPLSFNKIENRFLDKGALVPGIQKFGNHLFRLRLGNIFAKKINPIDVIDEISPIPLLIIQGDKDPIIFKQHAEILYQKAKEPKKLIIIEDGLHAEELYRQNPKYFIGLCISWLKEIDENQLGTCV
jgi:pimeloyl-ACP methyl ester carboxylesterase